MLSCISVLWHVKEVSLWREPEKIRDFFGQCAAVRLVDKIPTLPEGSVLPLKQKYLTPNSAGAPVVSQSH